MSERSVSRALLRFGALTTAVVLAFGGAATGALAQEPETPTSSVEPTPTPTSEPSTPPSTSEPAPPSSTEPAPPSSAEPSTPVSSETPVPPVTTPEHTTSPAAPEPTKSSEKQEQKTAAALPDIKVTVALDKAEYQSHEQVRLTVTLTNQAAVAAERVRGNVSGIQIDDDQWGDFSWRSGGGRLAAGETRTIAVSGAIQQVESDGRVFVRGSVESGAGDANANDNFFTAYAKVTQTFGNVSGVVYADANRNGRLDAGEAVAGGKVSIYGGSPASEHRSITDTNGRFSFTNVPSGRYYSYYELAGGWLVDHPAGQEYFTVAVNQTTELVDVARRPFTEVLTATASLDKETYSYPAKAKISLTLKNTSAYPISGIQAACGRSGEGGNLGEGPGWGDLRYDRGGVTLGAGESRSFEIVEDVPESSRAKGVVLLYCDFAPNVGWNGDGPTASDSAVVTGGLGSYRIKTVHDKNSNWLIEPGEELSGIKISFKDRQTGAVVAERTSGADGKVEFTDVPVGTYWAAVGGDWKVNDGTSAQQVTVTEYGTDTSFWLTPGVGDPSPRGTLWFEKSSYESHETVRFWLTVTNVGGKTAERVRLDFPIYDVDTPDEVWGDFRSRGPGIQLAAGESRTFEASGTINEIKNGKLVIWGGIDYLGRPNPHNSGYRGEVAVVQTKGDITGVVYTDKNRNGQQDAGEAAAGAEVKANGGAPYGYFTTTTDAEGRYSFKDIPSGDYWVGYTLADGWIVHNLGGFAEEVRVQPGKPVQLTARAERPYSESLSATLTLDKDVYRVGEIAKITITLTNSGDQALGGIGAACNRIGDENQLGGRPSNGSPTGWGELLPPGKGVTVGPGETRTFLAEEEVPDAARVFGTVIAGCDFAPNPGWNNDGAHAYDSARVPGGFGALSGDLVYDRNGNWKLDDGEAIGNTRVVLRDRELGVDVAEAVSDAKGHVRFQNVPAGTYWAWVDGPWKFEDEWGGHVRVFADTDGGNDFYVVPVSQPETPAGITPPAARAGAGGSGDALARTGASVLGLGLVGALLVAFGFGASLIGRRRQLA